MNKIYLTLLGAFFTMLPCKSQTLSDGKVWNFVQRMYEHEDIERAYTVTVCGDTIANGLLCKKLVKVYQDTPNIQTAYAVFEKDSKVYGVYGEQTKLLLNFNLAVGDKEGEEEGYDEGESAQQPQVCAVDGKDASEEEGGQVGHESWSQETADDAHAHSQCPEHGDGGILAHIFLA